MSARSQGSTRRRVLASAIALAAAPIVSANLCAPAGAAAPLLGPSMPRHYRFRLGAFEVTNILDAAAVIDGPWPIVGEDQPRDAVDRLMRDSLLPAGRFQPGFTPTIVNTGREVVLFDTGNGADGFVPRPDGGWLAAMLAPAGFAPEQIDVVVLTHAHPDHIGGLMEGGRPLFPNARYVVGDVEHAFWSQEERLAAPKDSNAYPRPCCSGPTWCRWPAGPASSSRAARSFPASVRWRATATPRGTSPTTSRARAAGC
ncbi:MBL fold metallo-hydrolase [Azospirillum sp. ST 5-10]|uniref:MBL fold metallo-hydrolase n=1 Tax=unclassified Azospirillum TaxID=2630922 RepID=UPI003F49CC83